MPSTPAPPLPFEKALAELETILNELEDGTTSLEDALARYERGVGLLRHCYSVLRDAEQRVKLLAGFTDEGGAELKPFEHASSIETAKASVRKRTRPISDPGISE